MMLAQPVTIYEVVGETTPQTTITDVMFGAGAAFLGLAAAAIVLGLVGAGVLIGIRRMRRKKNADDDSGDAGVTRLGLNSP